MPQLDRAARTAGLLEMVQDEDCAFGRSGGGAFGREPALRFRALLVNGDLDGRVLDGVLASGRS